MAKPFCPVILAGGRGTRFWPLSRRAHPKPLLRLGSGPTLIEQAWARARLLAPAEDIFVATDRELADAVGEALPELRADHRIVEPMAGDTGPAAVHAAWFVRRNKGHDATLALMPADHRIEAPAAFVSALQEARRAAERGGLVCVGVPAQGPSSAYGYVECAEAAPGHASEARVRRFVEKPSAERAGALLAGGRCLWNSGIFVWRTDAFLEEAELVWPELGEALAQLRRDDVEAFFARAPRLAVDRAVLERSRNVRVVGAHMGWDDLGDWEGLARHLRADADGNVGVGIELSLHSTNCVVHSPGKPVVLLGVEDLVVVECADVLLVAGRASGQALREVPGHLERRGRRDLT